SFPGSERQDPEAKRLRSMRGRQDAFEVSTTLRDEGTVGIIGLGKGQKSQAGGSGVRSQVGSEDRRISVIPPPAADGWIADQATAVASALVLLSPGAAQREHGHRGRFQPAMGSFDPGPAGNARVVAEGLRDFGGPRGALSGKKPVHCLVAG